MQKFRIAILLPEVMEAIRAQALKSLDRYEDADWRDPETDAEYVEMITNLVKIHWCKVPTAMPIPDDFDMRDYPEKPRYTEHLFETNEFLEGIFNIPIPIVTYKGKEVYVNEVPEFYFCEPIFHPLDGDDALSSLSNAAIKNEIEVELNPDEQIRLGFMMRAASNLSLIQGKLKPDKYIN